MRYRATLGNPKKPKERINVSFLAKSEKAAKAKLRRLFPKLAKTNPSDEWERHSKTGRSRYKGWKVETRQSLRGFAYEITAPGAKYPLDRKDGFKTRLKALSAARAAVRRYD